jgi:F-type H+-transporting ATPase subunit a
MVFTIFTFILTANLLGLIPYSSTITGYLIITFALAVIVLVGVWFHAFRVNGIAFFGSFIPSGCPTWLWPLIIPIELISIIFRLISLPVRLFANMMAGHLLLGVLAGFGFSILMFQTAFVSGVFIFSPLVIYCLVFLEVAVAFIQAIVFTILTCVYLDEAINMH